ncbi:hypothetical protein JCM1841_005044 [Sporobolomyces salmonicolor]
MSLGKCCVSGHIHTGEPTGSIQEIGGVSTYVSLPSGDYDKTKALLFLTDVFGLPLPNNRLLADTFAASGIAVYAPDLFNGEAIDMEAMHGGKVDLPAWLSTHGADVTRPVAEKVIAALKAQGVTRFAATGYCYGARLVADFVLNDTIQVAIVAHPSLLQVPEDLEALNKKSTPFLWHNALKDYHFGPEQQATAKKILGDNSAHVFIDWEGQEHGFAIRGDSDKPDVKAAAEGAFKASAEFIKKHL